MSDAAELADIARQTAESAYAPYSDFRVGAVVVADDGRRFVGVNVENAAYGSTLCAEATAIASAVAAGVRKIDTVAVGCLDGAECFPCGNCRQMMREFEVRRVIGQGSDGEPVVRTLDELFPDSFGPESLSG